MNYNLLTYEVERRLAGARFKVVPISAFEVMLQYGCSERATDEQVGTPILRMNNLQAEGWDLRNIKYIALDDDELSRWRLERGDIVFNRTNSKELVGKCEVFEEDGEWVFASYLMRLRVDRKQVEPEFLAAFLNAQTGRIQIDRESRQIIGMSNINAQEIRTLRVPLPKPRQQQEMLRILAAGRAARKKKLAEAEALLVGLDDFLLDSLGISLPIEVYPTVFAVRTTDVRRLKKLYPAFFHPERINVIRAVESRYPGKHSAALSAIADFVRDQRIVDAADEYLGLANVQPCTGERIDSTEEDGKGNCFEYRKDDVLFARLRPYLNKVYRAEANGICSTEFHVIRIHKDAHGRPIILPDYLGSVLRSRIVLAQTRHMMTGNTHPRLANEDVVNLVVPIPDIEVQQDIAGEVVRRREKARSLRDDAQFLWENAKRKFEEELFGAGSNVERVQKTANTKGGRK